MGVVEVDLHRSISQRVKSLASPMMAQLKARQWIFRTMETGKRLGRDTERTSAINFAEDREEVEAEDPRWWWW